MGQMIQLMCHLNVRKLQMRYIQVTVGLLRRLLKV